MTAPNPWAGVLEHWKLDETTGTRKATYTGVDLDDSWGTYTGASSAAGKFGNAFHCYGVDTGIGRYNGGSYAGTAAVSSGTGDFSLSLWVKLNPALVDDGSYLIGRVDIDSGFEDYSIVLSAYTGGTADIRFVMGEERASYMPTITMDSNWHHVAATYYDTDGTMEIWWDGVKQASDHTGTISPRDSGDGWLFVGTHRQAVGYLRDRKVDVDEITLWRRKLSDAEIALIAGGLEFGVDHTSPPVEEAASLVCEVRDPAGVIRAVFGPADEWAKFTATQGRMGYNTISLSLPSTHPVLQEVYGGLTFYARPAGWTLWVVYRGYDWRGGSQTGASREDCFAKGTVIQMEDEDVTDGGSQLSDVAQMVTITTMALCDRTIGQRQTMSASWARYRKDGGPISTSYFVKHLVDNQTDNTMRPPGYISAGGDATDYGPFSRDAGLTSIVSSVATTLSYLRIDSGQSVLDTARELSATYDIGWSFRVSPTARTWRLYLYDGQGVDRTSAAGPNFSRSLGNLFGVKRVLDYSGESNTSWVAGKGTRERQLAGIGWTVDATSKALFGTLETGERHDSAWANEVLIEKAIQAGVMASRYEHWTGEVRDTDDYYFGRDYAVGDLVSCADEARAVTFSKAIVLATVDSSSPTRIRLVFGDITSRINDAGGSGGGGRSSRGGTGHRKAGGATAPLITEQEVPQRWCPDVGEIVHATQANTPFKLQGDRAVSCNPITVRGVNNGELEDKVGELLISSCAPLAPSEIPSPCPTVPTDFSVTIPDRTVCTEDQQIWLTPCIESPGARGVYHITICFNGGDTIGVISCSGGAADCCASSCTVKIPGSTPAGWCMDALMYLDPAELPNYCGPVPGQCIRIPDTTVTATADIPNCGQYQFDSWAYECIDNGGVKTTRKVPGIASSTTCSPAAPVTCPPPAV